MAHRTYVGDGVFVTYENPEDDPDFQIREWDDTDDGAEWDSTAYDDGDHALLAVQVIYEEDNGWRSYHFESHSLEVYKCKYVS